MQVLSTGLFLLIVLLYILVPTVDYRVWAMNLLMFDLYNGIELQIYLSDDKVLCHQTTPNRRIFDFDIVVIIDFWREGGGKWELPSELLSF